MINKVLVFCTSEHQCCLDVCYGESNIKNIVESSGLLFGYCDDELAIRYGLDKAPSILFMKNDKIVYKKLGKLPKSELIELIEKLI